VSALTQYIDGVEQTVNGLRLQTKDYGRNGDRAFHRLEFAITKLSMLDTAVIAREYQDAPSVDEFKDFSAGSMGLARLNKFWLPVGLGSVMVCYPLAVMQTVPDELSSFVNTYAPKHFSAFEFPVIAEVGTQQLHYFTGTPLWGMAYYNGFRTEVEQLLGF
jgi:hypothetical protein